MRHNNCEYIQHMPLIDYDSFIVISSIEISAAAHLFFRFFIDSFFVRPPSEQRIINCTFFLFYSAPLINKIVLFLSPSDASFSSSYFHFSLLFQNCYYITFNLLLTYDYSLSTSLPLLAWELFLKEILFYYLLNFMAFLLPHHRWLVLVRYSKNSLLFSY